MDLLVKILIAFVLLSAVLYGVSCNLVRDTSDAERIADHFYSMIQANDFRSTIELYEPEFFVDNHIPPVNWVERQKNMHEKLGPMVEYKLMNWKEQGETQTGEPGTFYQLNYLVTYANDTTTETFIMKKEKDSNKIQILRRNVNPTRLYLEPAYE